MKQPFHNIFECSQKLVFSSLSEIAVIYIFRLTKLLPLCLCTLIRVAKYISPPLREAYYCDKTRGTYSSCLRSPKQAHCIHKEKHLSHPGTRNFPEVLKNGLLSVPFRGPGTQRRVTLSPDCSPLSSITLHIEYKALMAASLVVRMRMLRLGLRSCPVNDRRFQYRQYFRL